jgi:hypothetical protein
MLHEMVVLVLFFLVVGDFVSISREFFRTEGFFTFLLIFYFVYIIYNMHVVSISPRDYRSLFMGS